VHNYSSRWVETAARIPQSLYDRDPIFTHMAVNPIPKVWGKSDYELAGVGEIWEESSRMGIRSGVAVTVECEQGIALSVGLSRDCDEKLPAEISTDLMAHTLLFATCLRSRVSDLVLPQLQPTYSDLPKLTPRELDVLKWTREGKTAWELGNILGIAYSTANFHLQNAQRKLDSTDKHRAVLKAMEMHLLD
jgi:DNA-binding CsgD family transcriptional regulator